MERLRDWRDETTWGQFLSRYGKLVYRVALRAGLREDEADEVVQETALAVARKMPEFEYRPGQCSFEGWVRRMARLRIMDQLRRRGREERVGHADGVGCVTARGGDPGSGTGEERSWMAEPCVTPDDDAAWMEAWKEMLLGRALERVRLAATPEHYQNLFHDRDGGPARGGRGADLGREPRAGVCGPASVDGAVAAGGGEGAEGGRARAGPGSGRRIGEGQGHR